MYIHKNIHIYLYIYIHIHKNTYIYIHICISIIYIIYLHIYIYEPKYTYRRLGFKTSYLHISSIITFLCILIDFEALFPMAKFLISIVNG